MAWRRTGNRPLSEAMLVHCTDAYMRHSASLSELYAYRWTSIHRCYDISRHNAEYKDKYAPFPILVRIDFHFKDQLLFSPIVLI